MVINYYSYYFSASKYAKVDSLSDRQSLVSSLMLPAGVEIIGDTFTRAGGYQGMPVRGQVHQTPPSTSSSRVGCNLLLTGSVSRDLTWAQTGNDEDEDEEMPRVFRWRDEEE